jgi:hypothetical protein
MALLMELSRNSGARSPAHAGPVLCAEVRKTVLGPALVLSFLLSCCGIRAQISREYDVKAVFLFNFAQFVDWPAEAFPNIEAPLTIGVLGIDPFGLALSEVVKNETVRNRKVVVHHFQRVEEVGLCHILFISRSEARRLPQILAELSDRPILTVSDMDEFALKGGMIRFYTDRGKVRFRINNAAARSAHVTISSKLLRLAEAPSPEPEPQ